MKATNTLGILREVKNKWERRVAVTPKEVKKLVDSNIRVIVQPCERRVFKNVEYKNAGAILSDDLSEAACILGVKEFPRSTLLNDHSYLLFSHVIKGQPYNMPFLDSCLSKNIRLFDYECIKDDPRKTQYLNKPNAAIPRLVAFGKYAGLAGMITGLRGLGEQLLALGASTPFLHVSSSYMYSSYDNALNDIKNIGQLIEQYGLPKRFGPMTFVFTGGGNVTQGAIELFKHLPHEMVKPEDLANLEKNFSNKKVYGCVLPVQAIVAPSGGDDSVCQQFEMQDYFDHPERYKPIFHKSIAPYARVLVNGMYWDGRYPRLLTCRNMSELRYNNPYSLLSVFDITCDIGGSIEFTRRSTSTESPFMVYDPFVDELSTTVEANNHGVLLLAVDALPAELPRESSEHFSSVLSPFLAPLAKSDYSKFKVNDIAFDDNKDNDLPIEMYNAVIADHGALTGNFRYIDTLRRKNEKERAKSLTTVASGESSRKGASHNMETIVLRIDGHLFDSGLINQVFDLIEKEKAEYNIIYLQSRVNTDDLIRASRLVVQIDILTKRVKDLIKKMQMLIDVVPKAQAKLTQLPFGASHSWTKKSGKSSDSITIDDLSDDMDKVKSKKAGGASSKEETPYVDWAPAIKLTAHKIVERSQRDTSKPTRNVLILGSGFVAQPAIDYLCYSGQNKVTVATNDINAGKKLCNRHPFAEFAEFDASNNEQINELVSKSDIVVSLLPSFMHIPIADACVNHGVDLVTASYINNEMREFHDKAIENNVTLLNEIGLDPGLDHASTMKLIRGIRNNSNNEEVITSFRSVCGGLPAPEAANNMFGYKFSWSPIGVLRAALADALFLQNGKNISVDGSELMIHSRALNPNPYPALSLEHIPNRNSLLYIDEYTLDRNELKTMYRGTLRYEGYTQLMYGFKLLGLLSNEKCEDIISDEPWMNYLARLVISNSSNSEMYSHINVNSEDFSASKLIEIITLELSKKHYTSLTNGFEIDKFLLACEWLGIFNKDTNVNDSCLTPVEMFCDLLEETLYYEKGERDMVVMHHVIETKNKNTKKLKEYQSSLLVYGDEEYSAMSRTVGFPVAISAQELLNRKYENNMQGLGVVGGGHEAIAEKVLSIGKPFGIKFVETVKDKKF